MNIDEYRHNVITSLRADGMDDILSQYTTRVPVTQSEFYKFAFAWIHTIIMNGFILDVEVTDTADVILTAFNTVMNEIYPDLTRN